MKSLLGLVMFILVAGFGASNVSAQMMSDGNPMVGGIRRVSGHFEPAVFPAD